MKDKKGHLQVICGPMFSGKSEELIRRLTRYEIANKRCMVLSPDIDNRYGEGKIFSHAGRAFKCKKIPTKGEAVSIPTGTDVLAFDEAQFFEKIWLVGSVVDSINEGLIVIIAGLDMDFRKYPFGAMPELLSMATFVVKLKAVCQSCGSDAMYTQRLLNGKPAPLTGETVIVGGMDKYEARCENCWEEG